MLHKDNNNGQVLYSAKDFLRNVQNLKNIYSVDKHKMIHLMPFLMHDHIWIWCGGWLTCYAQIYIMFSKHAIWTDNLLTCYRCFVGTILVLVTY